MIKRLSHALLLSIALPADRAAAIDEVIPELPTTVVTATRSETPLRQIGSTVSVVTRDDIRKRQVISVAEALRVVPGLDVLNSGGPGRTTSVFLRGATSSQTLVLIDGVEMNDPSSPNNGFDFANLTIDNIERIEVLRGGESSIYGSNPLGGVVNIITRKGREGPHFTLEGQGGSWDSFRVLGGASGGNELGDYSITSSRTEIGGFSAADRLWGNPEPDGYRNTTVDSRFGLHPAELLDLGWTLHYNQGRNDLDYDYPVPHDALHYHGTVDEIYTRGFGSLHLFDDFWDQTVGLAYSRTNRTTDNYDPTLPYSLDSQYLGEKLKVDWQNNLHLLDTNTLTLGAEDEEDRMNSPTDAIGSQSYNTQGYYLLDQFNPWKSWFGTAAVRFDQNNRVGGKVTWRVTQALLLDRTNSKLRGSYGTGFKVPSLAELYDPFVGNPDLRSETSANWDIGIDQAFWNGRTNLTVTYFNNRFDNLIQYTTATNQVENIAKAYTYGVETAVEIKPWDQLNVRANYTYTHTENLETGAPLIRRPAQKGVLETNYLLLDKVEVNLTIIVVGPKSDLFDTRVPGYVLANLGAGYQVTPNARVFARVDNLLDQHYQEVFGYGTSGIAGYGGLTLTY